MSVSPREVLKTGIQKVRMRGFLQWSDLDIRQKERNTFISVSYGALTVLMSLKWCLVLCRYSLSWSKSHFLDMFSPRKWYSDHYLTFETILGLGLMSHDVQTGDVCVQSERQIACMGHEGWRLWLLESLTRYCFVFERYILLLVVGSCIIFSCHLSALVWLWIA